MATKQQGAQVAPVQAAPVSAPPKPAEPAPSAPSSPPEPARAEAAQGPDLVEATARTETFYRGVRVLAGETRRIPRADYEAGRAVWETEGDLRMQASARAVSTAEKRAEDAEFWGRVARMGEDRKRAELARAQVQEEQAKRQAELAQQAREAAERKAGAG